MSDAPLIFERMAAVLADLDAVGKDRRNSDQGFSFRGIEDIVNALHDCLGDNHVFYLPRVLERVPEVRQTKHGATLWTVHLHVGYRFYTTDGSFVEADAWGEGVDMADKATSKAMTFAQKSTLLQVFNIATADLDDPDATGVESVPPTDDPRDWYQQNGWTDKAEHDAYRTATTDLLGKATAAEQAAFKAWREAEGIPSFTQAHTRAHAENVSSHIFDFVKDPKEEPKAEKPPRRQSNDQRLAKKGRECALSAEERADAIWAVSDRRPEGEARTRLGKELSDEEVLAVEEAYVGLADRSLEFVYDDEGQPSLVAAQKLPVAP